MKYLVLILLIFTSCETDTSSIIEDQFESRWIVYANIYNGLNTDISEGDSIFFRSPSPGDSIWNIGIKDTLSSSIYRGKHTSGRRKGFHQFSYGLEYYNQLYLKISDSSNPRQGMIIFENYIPTDSTVIYVVEDNE